MSALEIESYTMIGETIVTKEADGSIKETTRREENGSYIKTVVKRFTDEDRNEIVHIKTEMNNPNERREVHVEATYKNTKVESSSLSEEIPYGKRGNRIKYTITTEAGQTSRVYVIYDKSGRKIKEGTFGYNEDFERVLDK